MYLWCVNTGKSNVNCGFRYNRHRHHCPYHVFVNIAYKETAASLVRSIEMASDDRHEGCLNQILRTRSRGSIDRFSKSHLYGNRHALSCFPSPAQTETRHNQRQWMPIIHTVVANRVCCSIRFPSVPLIGGQCDACLAHLIDTKQTIDPSMCVHAVCPPLRLAQGLPTQPPAMTTPMAFGEICNLNDENKDKISELIGAGSV